MSSDLSQRGPEQWDDPWRRWDAGAQQAAERPLSKAAVTALVFGIIGGVVFAYVFGFVGLAATGRGGSRRGRGFAVAGLVLATVWLVAIVGLVVFVVSRQADRDADGTVTGSGTAAVYDLRVGDCLRDAGSASGEFSEAALVPCDQPHRSQVAAVVTLTATAYDQHAIQTQASQRCQDETPSALTTDAPDDLQLYFLAPDEDAWNAHGEHTATCVVSSGADLTRSYVSGH